MAPPRSLGRSPVPQISVGIVETPLIYVASPLGFAEPGRLYLRQVLHPALESAGFIVLDPWEDTTGIVAAAAEVPPGDPQHLTSLATMNSKLGANNAGSIARSDGVLAILDGSDVDSGTASEVGYAVALGVPVVGLRTDLRLSGDNAAATVNLQVQYFIEASGGTICSAVDEAITAVGSTVADRYLFHLALRSQWEEATASGRYLASTRERSLEEVGFIHLSFARQLTATARRHYADVDASELLLLTVDRRKLSSRLIVEHAPSLGEGFPHVYGPINLDAVVSVDDVARDEDGDLRATGR
jgi:uncharacterized protein (DUF952 family)/nucleoside 2-deoxyribosyltransferase